MALDKSKNMSSFPPKPSTDLFYFALINDNIRSARMKRLILPKHLFLGEIFTFDNHRILHGRKGYQGSRLLIGGYLDWDLIKSRTRVLKSQLTDTNTD